jgi:hypothetical protein
VVVLGDSAGVPRVAVVPEAAIRALVCHPLRKEKVKSC